MFQFLTSTSNSSKSGSGSGSLESLKKVFANPVLYIVIGAIALLIVLIYLVRRFVKAKSNATTIVIRRGRIYKVLDKDNPKCFLVPFIDSIGAIITNDEKAFASDKLFINNGPDALYKIDYTLKYRVINPKEFFKYSGKLDRLLPTKLNDELRIFADQGNAFVLIRDYKENAEKILNVINKAVSEFFIEVIEFKINLIEPIGRS